MSGKWQTIAEYIASLLSHHDEVQPAQETERPLRKITLLTKHQRSTVVTTYKNGTSMTELAHTYTCHKQTISRILREADVEIRTNQIPEAQARQALELYGELRKHAEVGRRLSLDRKAVRSIALRRQ